MMGVDLIVSTNPSTRDNGNTDLHQMMTAAACKEDLCQQILDSHPSLLFHGEPHGN
uniref:Uncharacterized protein n=1 Tax=Arundo donax TaxID=35708 RepID=A0A0A9D8P4_ARUDO